MKNVHANRETFIAKLRREHRLLIPTMLLVTGLFVGTLLNFKLGQLQQLGLLMLVGFGLYSAHASFKMMKASDTALLEMAMQRQLGSVVLVCLGTLFFTEFSVPSTAALVILFVSYDQTKTQRKQAQYFAQHVG